MMQKSQTAHSTFALLAPGTLAGLGGEPSVSWALHFSSYPQACFHSPQPLSLLASKHTGDRPPFGANTASGLPFSASLHTHGCFVSIPLHTSRTSPKAFCSPRRTLFSHPVAHPGDALVPSDTRDMATPWPPWRPPVPSLLALLLGCLPGLLPQPLLLPFTVATVWASVLGLPLSPSGRPSPVNHNQLTLFLACFLS